MVRYEGSFEFEPLREFLEVHAISEEQKDEWNKAVFARCVGQVGLQRPIGWGPSFLGGGLGKCHSVTLEE